MKSRRHDAERTRARRPAPGERGLGLAELLIGLAITGLILTTVGMTLVAVIRNSNFGRDQQSATHQLRDGLFWLNQDTQSGVVTQSTVAANDVVLQWTDQSTGSTYVSHYYQSGTDLLRSLTVNGGGPIVRTVARNLTVAGFSASQSGAAVSYTLSVQNGASTQSRSETTTMRVADTLPTPYFTVTAAPTSTSTSTSTITSTPTSTPTRTPTPTNTPTPTTTPTLTNTPTATPTNTPTSTPTPAFTCAGLTGDYYDNIDRTALKLTRIDSTVNFDWVNGSPDPVIGVDTFSIRWTGFVVPLYTQTYTFYTQSDDGVRLWVNGTQVVNNWTDHSTTEDSGTIALTAGVQYAVTMEFYENGGQAVAKLSWSSASQAKQIIPSGQLCYQPGSASPTSTPTATNTPAPPPVVVCGGISGDYYDNIDLTALKLTRIDPTVNFDWVNGSPDSVIGVDTFSIRWTGFVVPLYTQTYTFYTQSDDGVRLWVNGTQVVNNWTDHSTTEDSGTIALTAGVQYAVTMEFYENGGQAVAKLSWSSASQAKQIIPATQLCYASNLASPTSSPTATNTPVPTSTNTPTPAPTSTFTPTPTPTNTFTPTPTPNAITFRSSSFGGASSGSLTLTKPAGTTTNDVMIASISLRPQTGTITAPAGWTLVRRVNNASANANSLAVYYKVAGGAEPANYTWSFSSSSGAAGGIQTFSGVSTSSPVDVESGQNTASSLTHTTPSITTTVANAMIVTSHAFASAATWSPPGGMTEGFEAASIAAPSSGGESLESNYAVQASAGATGTKQATAASNADAGNAHILALRPGP